VTTEAHALETTRWRVRRRVEGSGQTVESFRMESNRLKYSIKPIKYNDITTTCLKRVNNEGYFAFLSSRLISDTKVVSSDKFCAPDTGYSSLRLHGFLQSECLERTLK
jgi:hypothetical protein